MPCGMHLNWRATTHNDNRHHRPTADEHLVWMRPWCALPQPAYERIWPGRWIAVVSTSPKRRDGGVAHHAAHAVRRTGPNYRLFTSGRSRRSRAHSCGSSVDRVRASTATCGRRVNAKVECNLRLGSRLHQHSAGRCHLYEKIAVTRHILWTASFEGRVLRSTWVSYADIWRRANSVSLIERQRSAARTSAPNISFNG